MQQQHLKVIKVVLPIDGWACSLAVEYTVKVHMIIAVALLNIIFVRATVSAFLRV